MNTCMTTRKKIENKLQVLVKKKADLVSRRKQFAGTKYDSSERRYVAEKWSTTNTFVTWTEYVDPLLTLFWLDTLITLDSLDTFLKFGRDGDVARIEEMNTRLVVLDQEVEGMLAQADEDMGRTR